MDLFTLISLIVAVIAVLKLRSVLGRDTGGAERRADRALAERRRAQAGEPDGAKVVTLPRREPPAVDVPASSPATDAEQRIASFAGATPAVAAGLMAIGKTDPAFDPQAFLAGARKAYEMIVIAFAEGNRKMLKDLLSSEVLEGFNAEIAAREKRGEGIDQSFVGINKADITDAEVSGGIAHITVRFVSELISATRDRAGAVTSGDPQKIKEVTDVWTFSRDVSSARARQTLNWRLTGTQEA